LKSVDNIVMCPGRINRQEPMAGGSCNLQPAAAYRYQQISNQWPAAGTQVGSKQR